MHLCLYAYCLYGRERTEDQFPVRSGLYSAIEHTGRITFCNIPFLFFWRFGGIHEEIFIRKEKAVQSMNGKILPADDGRATE